MRVVALFRVSTERQANEGASLDAQQRVFRELARNSRWNVVAEFRGCESATQVATERRVLQEALGCIRQQAPDALYVHEQSRLTRGDELEVALLLRELRERGVRIIVGGVVRDLASIDERFMVGVQGLMDRAECDRMKERTARGRRERALQGRKNVGRSPFGYRNPGYGQPGRGTLQVVPAEAPLVRRIFAMAAGGTSPRAIARTLNQEGIPTRRGSQWCKTAIVRMLQNPAYVGDHLSFAWRPCPNGRSFRFDPDNRSAVLVENAHEAIVDRNTWTTVARRAKPVRTSRPRFLTGLLWVNGSRAVGDSCHETAYYRIPRGQRGGPWLEAKETDQRVWDAFVEVATQREYLDAIAIQADRRAEHANLAAALRAEEARATRGRKRLEALLEMRADGEITKDQYVQQRDKTERDRIAAERAASQLRSAASGDKGEALSQALAAVRLLVEGSRRLDPGQRRSVLSSVVRRVDIVATRRATPQHRGDGGRYGQRTMPRWMPTEATFVLESGDDGSRHLGTGDC